jgi:hypothetical protein
MAPPLLTLPSTIHNAWRRSRRAVEPEEEDEMGQKLSKEQQQALQEILRKAAVDPQFRKACLTNPAEAVAKSGLALSGAQWDAVLAQLPQALHAEDDLTPEELEQVAGGDVDGIFGRRCQETRIECPGSLCPGSIQVSVADPGEGTE